MKVQLIKPNELTDEMLTQWRQFQNESVELESPFYSPTFTQLVSRHRDDVEVAVIYEQDRIVSFFPFQRTNRNHGLPVGWKLNDYQGFILEKNTTIEPIELIRQCKLSSWRFDHLLASQTFEMTDVFEESKSPFIDLSSGFDQYLADKQKASKRIQSHIRKSRKLTREIGPLRIEFHSPDDASFQQLIQWKSEHLAAMGMNNVFGTKWGLETARDIFHAREPNFEGALAVMYAGDHLVAAHLGMRNEKVLHWWLTTYNQEFQNYSPGAVFLLELMRICPEHGVSRIDLGKGQEGYKLTFQTGFNPLVEGIITTSPWQRTLFKSSSYLRTLVRKTPLHRLAKSIRNSRSNGTNQLASSKDTSGE